MRDTKVDTRDIKLVIHQIMEQADGIKLTKKYSLGNAADPISTFGSPVVPAIAIPVQTKTDDTFDWPDSHRAYLKQLLPQVTKILIIGWRRKEAHFLNLLREKLPSGGVTQITHFQLVGRDSSESADIAK